MSFDNSNKFTELFQSIADKTDKCNRIIVGCTGSVASIKIPQLVDELLKTEVDKKLQICIITTDKALHFFDERTLNTVTVFHDEDEWQKWSHIGDPVLHIELRRWADVMVVAPLDANTLAKMANGICDNLLTCVVRAWDMERPLLFAPSMNTHMWHHPLTARQIEILKGFGYTEIPCVEKTLACGDTGKGAMAEVPTIVSAVMEALKFC